VQEHSILLEPSSRTTDIGLLPAGGGERETFELSCGPASVADCPLRAGWRGGLAACHYAQAGSFVK